MSTAATYRRVDSYKRSRTYYGYEDGSAVRSLDEAIPVPRRKTSTRTKEDVERARSRSTAINRGFIIFLAVICALATVLCVSYLQKRSQLISLRDEIAVLENEYAGLKADNDAKYNQIISSFTLEDVKDAASNRLGMHYAEADQVKYYSLEQDSYVRTYTEVTQAE